MDSYLIGDIYYFKRPQPIINILKHFARSDPEAREVSNIFAKKLNRTQAQELRTRYQPHILNCVKAVPEEYPYYALINVSVRSFAQSDLNEIQGRYCSYLNDRIDSNIKYKMSKCPNLSQKYKQLLHHCGCGMCKRSKKEFRMLKSRRHSTRELIKEGQDCL